MLIYSVCVVVIMFAVSWKCLYCISETQAMVKRELFRIALIGTDPRDILISQTTDCKTDKERPCSGDKGDICSPIFAW